MAHKCCHLPDGQRLVAGHGFGARGAALVIAMLLLFILATLAASGMSMSTAELVMAGNEQFHRRASDASSSGIEGVITRLAVSTPPLADTVVAGDYVVTVRYAGDESSLPQSSAEKFIGRHFEIESTGQAARNARDVQIQGVMVITAAGGVSTYTQIGTGLQGGSSP